MSPCDIVSSAYDAQSNFQILYFFAYFSGFLYVSRPYFPLIQQRNRESDLEDFHAERPLYAQSGALVEFLLEYCGAAEHKLSSAATSDSMNVFVEALAMTMFEYVIIEEEDVKLTQVRPSVVTRNAKIRGRFSSVL